MERNSTTVHLKQLMHPLISKFLDCVATQW